MAARLPRGQGTRGRTAARVARRAWPLVLTAWERWQALSPEEKERYRRRAREYAARGRRAVEQARARRSGRGSGRR